MTQRENWMSRVPWPRVPTFQDESKPKGKKNQFAYYFIPDGSESKESACNTKDPSSISGLGRSPGKGNGHPPQYSCLENVMDGGAWQTIVHEVAKSFT